MDADFAYWQTKLTNGIQESIDGERMWPFRESTGVYSTQGSFPFYDCACTCFQGVGRA